MSEEDRIDESATVSAVRSDGFVAPPESGETHTQDRPVAPDAGPLDSGKVSYWERVYLSEAASCFLRKAQLPETAASTVYALTALGVFESEEARAAVANAGKEKLNELVTVSQLAIGDPKTPSEVSGRRND